MSTQCSEYLFDIIPSSENFYDTRKKQRPFFNCRTDCFKYSFFPSSLSEWSHLALEIQNSEPIAIFKSKLLSFIRPSKRCMFNVPEGVKYLTRLRLCFSHLNEHKFRHGFLDTLNPLCNCSLEVEDNEQFFLRCLNFENARRLFIDISSVNSSFKSLPSHLKVELVLFGDSKPFAIDNNHILLASVKYIMTTNRFSVPLFRDCFPSLALNIYIHFSPQSPTQRPDFFHCSVWESSEICACAVFSCLFSGYLFVKYFSFVFCLVQL